jgi:hypothetical protein
VPDLGEGFPAVARQAIDEGERALRDLRENTVERWIAAGGAWKALQNVAMNRSRSNSPSGRRYNQIYAVLVNRWPELAKAHKGTRSDAIWLFENSDRVLPWLATLSQKERDQWTHPSTLRRHYEKRHPDLIPTKPAAYKARPPRHAREWQGQPLGERSREDLEALIRELDIIIEERDREIIEQATLLEEKNRAIKQLQNDLAWARSEIRQLEGVITPPMPATAVRPDGEAVEVVHAVARANQEVPPPLQNGHPDYVTWAKKLIAPRIERLSAQELHWLLADNSAHLDAYETAYPGAGAGLEDRINARIAELEGQ